MFKVLGVTIIVLAIAMATIPMFTDCQSQGKAITLANGKTVPMKCHWTGVAEFGLAFPIVGVGAMMVGSRRKESQRNLGIMGIVLGALAISFPTKLIGVCSSTMLCHTVMKPSLVAAGSLVIAASAVGIVLSLRKNLSDS